MTVWLTWCNLKRFGPDHMTEQVQRCKEQGGFCQGFTPCLCTQLICLQQPVNTYCQGNVTYSLALYWKQCALTSPLPLAVSVEGYKRVEFTCFHCWSRPVCSALEVMPHDFKAFLLREQNVLLQRLESCFYHSCNYSLFFGCQSTHLYFEIAKTNLKCKSNLSYHIWGWLHKLLWLVSQVI